MGGGGGPGVHFRTNFGRAGGARQQQHHHGGGGGGQGQARPQSIWTQLMQFAPIAMLLLMSLGSWGGGSQPVYSFSPYNAYNIEKSTTTPGLPQGLKYYVQPTFDRKYAPRSHALHKLERDVATNYRDLLSQECNRERIQKNQNIQRVSFMLIAYVFCKCV